MSIKKYIYIASAALVMGMTSCEKRLEIEFPNDRREEDVLKTEADLQRSLNGVYERALGSFSGNAMVMSDLTADQIDGSQLTEDFGEIFNRRSSIFGGYKNGYYTGLYRVVFNANTVLENLTLATEANRTRVEGEAKFMRALMHFVAVNLWAQPFGFSQDNSHPGVPLRLQTGVASESRATVKQVYDQIIADLKDAETKLPAQNGIYADRWAAKGLLAKVYFQMNDFQNAYTYANDVISNSGTRFQLDTDYSKRFSVGESKEIVFGFRDEGFFRFGEYRNVYRSDLRRPTLFFNQQFASAALAAPDDARRAWYSTTLRPGITVLTKFNKDRFDLPVVHLTELKLIRAEAAAELGTNLNVAVQDLNDILRRAYNNNASRLLPATASRDLLINTARTQRELELIGEGNRLYEIKRIGARNNVNIDRRGSIWNCPGMVLQFPQGERGANDKFQMNPEGGCN